MTGVGGRVYEYGTDISGILIFFGCFGSWCLENSKAEKGVGELMGRKVYLGERKRPVDTTVSASFLCLFSSCLEIGFGRRRLPYLSIYIRTSSSSISSLARAVLG